jgi:hypothetical protein
MSGAEFRAFQAGRPDHERWELIGGVAMMMAPSTIGGGELSMPPFGLRCFIPAAAAPDIAASAPIVVAMVHAQQSKTPPLTAGFSIVEFPQRATRNPDALSISIGSA